ncbi:MAG TPA: hypothetical protein VFD84_10420 [Candidatus Binatia bacterium]|jgi:rubrerythrin|nr:hypothetical protein [Candidatus Binatia bacterium]
MRLDELLARCEALERRAAAIYRGFAAANRANPARCAFWTALAREEEEHARTIAAARQHAAGPVQWQTRLDGWEEALADVEERLAAAEALPPAATPEQQLSAALALEMTEIEAMRHEALGALDEPPTPDADHAERLADAAAAHGDDPQLRLQAALVRARARLARRAR